MGFVQEYSYNDPSQMKMTKQAFLTDFFLKKLWRTLIKKFGGGILIEN